MGVGRGDPSRTARAEGNGSPAIERSCQVVPDTSDRAKRRACVTPDHTDSDLSSVSARAVELEQLELHIGNT